MNATWLDIGLLGRVRAIVAPWSCSLVGGAVRDHLLGRPARDLDLVTVGDEAGEALSRELPARSIPIGGDRFAATRLVTEDGVIDLWDRGDTSLVEELSRRDLTINAIAIDLADGRIHDPHGGRDDLERRLLRATTDASFVDDPLRVLRLARLAAELEGFEVDAHTLELASAAAAGLSGIAAERRREELGRSLRAPAPERALAVWRSVGFYPSFLAGQRPQAGSAAAAAFDRAHRARHTLTRLTRDWPTSPSRGADADGPPAPDPFTLFAALLLTAAEAEVDTLLGAGYASRREARDLALVRPQTRLPEEPAEQRWMLHRSAHCWPTALCFAAAADGTTPAREIERRMDRCVDLARNRGEEIFDPPPLLRGDEIRVLLELDSGPEVGVAARRLRRRQVEGRLGDREEAVRWLLNERRSSGADSAP